MSGWLHALLVQDGVAFQSGGSSSSLSTGSELIHLTGTPANGQVAAFVVRMPSGLTFDTIAGFNDAFPGASFALSFEDDSGSSSLKLTDGTKVLSIDFTTAASDIFATTNLSISSTGVLRLSGVTLGFFATTPGTAKATVTGSKGANAALASLMTALAGYGLVTDSTT